MERHENCNKVSDELRKNHYTHREYEPIKNTAEKSEHAHRKRQTSEINTPLGI